jgi:NAD(P)-dependent dehydrogenase (short-subunit alcohol dehydrogenase family)
MIKRQRGKVINVASVFATRVSRYMGAYAASKAALVQLTRTLALEWVRANVQVNALPRSPARFATAQRRVRRDEPGRSDARDPDIRPLRWGRNEQTPQTTNVLVVSDELAAGMLEVLRVAGARPLPHETAPIDSEKS